MSSSGARDEEINSQLAHLSNEGLKRLQGLVNAEIEKRARTTDQDNIKGQLTIDDLARQRAKDKKGKGNIGLARFADGVVRQYGNDNHNSSIF